LVISRKDYYVFEAIEPGEAQVVVYRISISIIHGDPPYYPYAEVAIYEIYDIHISG
jgi:hypothetical protein